MFSMTPGREFPGWGLSGYGSEESSIFTDPYQVNISCSRGSRHASPLFENDILLDDLFTPLCSLLPSANSFGVDFGYLNTFAQGHKVFGALGNPYL